MLIQPNAPPQYSVKLGGSNAEAAAIADNAARQVGKLPLFVDSLIMIMRYQKLAIPFYSFVF